MGATWTGQNIPGRGSRLSKGTETPLEKRQTFFVTEGKPPSVTELHKRLSKRNFIYVLALE